MQMRSRFTLLILVLGVLVFGTTGLAYNESPMLAERVAGGELPPVEERLPEEPIVVEPPHTIGRYGGEYRVAFTGTDMWTGEVGAFMGKGSLIKENGDFEIVPDVAESWEWADDATWLKVNLRPGIRWSDGHPFTADDLVFWYEKIAMNEEISPSVQSHFVAGGEVVEVEKLDTYTVRFNFAVPHPLFVNYLSRFGHRIVVPAHFLQNYHPDFVAMEELEAKTAEYGYEHWWQLFQYKQTMLNWRRATREVDAPTLLPYTVVERSTDVIHLERNPYYYKVDPEGNQLPYVDRIRAERVSNREVAELQAITGELDFFDGYTANLPMYHQYADTHNINVNLAFHADLSRIVPHFNQTHQDPVIREIMQDVRFRRAMSHAIDRDEMNRLLFLGLAEPRQGTVLPGAAQYREEYAQAYTEYSPDKANELLDEMGLEWDPTGTYRLRPDGEPLQLIMDAMAIHADYVEGAELIADYYTNVGVQTRVETRSQDLVGDLITSNDYDFTVSHANMTPGQMERMIEPFLPRGGGPHWRGAPLWGQWYDTDGAEGEEPIPEVKAMYEIWDTAITHPDPDVRAESIRKIVEWQSEFLMFIGTVGRTPKPIITSGNLKNVPDDYVFTFATEYLVPAKVHTWFFAE